VLSLTGPLASNRAAVAAPLLGENGALEGHPFYRGLLHVTADPGSDREVEAIWRLAEHVLEPHDPTRRAHSLMVSAEGLARLRAEGIAIRASTEELGDRLVGDAPAGVQAAIVAPTGRLGIFGAWWSQVRTLEEIHQRLGELEQSSQGRARLLSLGRSVEGREIQGLKIQAGEDPEAGGGFRPAILITGTHHAREWASPMVTMGLAEALVRGYLTDPQVRQVLNTLAIYLVPVVNVDGYVATHNGQRLQRKNMNQSCPVDLNRNYDIAFGLGAPAGGCNEESYPGPFAFSEPETRAIKELAHSLPGLRLFLDYHAPAEQVMIPFAHTRERPPHFETSRERAELYARTVKQLYGTVHPAREGFDLAQGQGGGAIDWFRTRGVESFAVELRDGRELAGFELPAEQLIPAAEENWTAFLELALAVARENAPAGALPSDEIVAGAGQLLAPGITAGGCSLSGGSARNGSFPTLVLLSLLAAGARRWRRSSPLG
jgi:murein tripeptide amidase MpaA